MNVSSVRKKEYVLVMSKAIVFMFSGQGSQYYQMGRTLYNEHSGFNYWMNECDKIVRSYAKVSLIDVLYNPRDQGQPFDRLLFTNPALIAIEYSLARVLMDMDIQPDYLLGYSLGEVTALVVNGSMSLDDGIHMAIDYADLLERESPLCGMLAVIESESIMQQFPQWFERCWLTGRSFSGSFVVGGLAQDIHRLQTTLTNNSIIYQKLPVNYGFHTQLIDPVEQKFKRLVRQISFSSIAIPTISSVKSGFLTEVTEHYLWDVGRKPVEFADTIGFIEQKQDCIYIDVGPSGSLNTFVKYLLPGNSESLHFELMNQYGRDLLTLEKLRTALCTERRFAV